MTFNSWLESIPVELKNDPIWRMEAYRLSLFIIDLAWHDVSKLAGDKRTISLADQLNRAVGSIGANIAEGYGRSSSKDEARFYEYSLGSARESRNWYYQGRHVLGKSVALHRMQLITQITRLLLCMIPNERGHKLEEEAPDYKTIPADLLESPPFPSLPSS